MAETHAANKDKFAHRHVLCFASRDVNCASAKFAIAIRASAVKTLASLATHHIKMMFLPSLRSYIRSLAVFQFAHIRKNSLANQIAHHHQGVQTNAAAMNIHGIIRGTDVGECFYLGESPLFNEKFM